MSGRNAPRVESFGCRLNIWESEVVQDQAAAAGLNDAIIFNTCAVTAEAERQARQAVRRARRDNPDAGSSSPAARRRLRLTAGRRWTKSITSSATMTS